MVEDQFYTLKEAAEVLRVSYSTIKRRVAAGDIPTVDMGVPGYRLPRISSEALREYIAGRTHVA